MNLQLGETIKALRKRGGETQEMLADVLGITSQAVSRWEQNAAYPDMELIPAIANYFGVTIDELFGYDRDREKKVDEIIARVDAFRIRARSDSAWVEECAAILREGLAEFPKNEKLMMALADTLCEAGWRRYQEWLDYDSEGYIYHRRDKHVKNEFWLEAVRLCEELVGTARDSGIFTRAVRILVLLYRNFGEYEKAASYANRMPGLENSREILLASASDGRAQAKYTGEALLALADLFSKHLVYGLFADRRHYETDMPIEKIKGAIDLFGLLCDDGNLGVYHGQVISLYLYLSRVQWERGYHDGAFESLDKALEHARALEALLDGREHAYTAPLVSLVKCPAGAPASIAAQLPEDWPFWSSPDCSQAEREIKADPRWAAWVRRTQEG